MNIKEAIIEWRTSEGLSQAKLSRMLGVRQSAVGNWEAGLRKPSLEMLIKLEMASQGKIQARDYAPAAFRLSA